MHHAVVQKQNNISFCMFSEPGCPTFSKKHRQRGNITLSIMKKNIEKPPKEIRCKVYTYLPTPCFVFFFFQSYWPFITLWKIVVKADIMVPWVKSQNSFLPDLKIYSFGHCSARNLMLGQRGKFEYY